MQTECNPALFEFPRTEGRQVIAAFDGGEITSDAIVRRRGKSTRNPMSRPRGELTHYHKLDKARYLVAAIPDAVTHRLRCWIGIGQSESSTATRGGQVFIPACTICSTVWLLRAVVRERCSAATLLFMSAITFGAEGHRSNHTLDGTYCLIGCSAAIRSAFRGVATCIPSVTAIGGSTMSSSPGFRPARTSTCAPSSSSISRWCRRATPFS